MLSTLPVAIHTAAWVRRWDEDLAPHLERAADLGFQGAEVSLLGLDASAASRLARVAAGLGLVLKCTTGLSAGTDITSADGKVRQAGLRYLRRAADVVAACGADLLAGVIYAPWGTGRTAGRAERTDRAADALAEAAPVFAERGITLGIEPLNRFETDLVTTAAEACALAEKIGAANVGILLDTFHMNIEERSFSAAVKTADRRLVHVQLADNDRGAPGSGHLDWGDVFAGLDAVGYRGWLSLELFLRSGLEVSDDLRIWRDISPDPTAPARAGLAYVRRWLGNGELSGEPADTDGRPPPIGAGRDEA
jgi:D-psicose/D-tagatose/L-ribulose 3-epimerase